MENTGIIIWFTFALISAVVCYKLAVKNKLNAGLAAVIGFLAPILSLAVYAYINSSMYKRLHDAPARSSNLKKWSFVIGGVLLIFGGLANLNDGGTTGDSIWYIIVILGGGYLIYHGFTKYKNIDSGVNKEQ